MKVGIMGCSGYAGRQLLNILVGHKKVEVVALSSNTYKGQSAKDVFRLAQYEGDVIIHSDIEFIAHAEPCDLIFLALPHKTSMAYAKQLLEIKGDLKIIDLSADHRFNDPGLYKKWYGCEHVNKESLLESTYGLSELNREKVKTSKIIGNPGCYPTSVLLGLLPLLKSGGIDLETIIVDAKSGYTGAGVKAEGYKMLAEGIDNMYPYGGTMHRHIGEIEDTIEHVTDQAVVVQFIPNLIPVKRGIISNIYVTMTGFMDHESVIEKFKKYYDHEAFVKVHDGIPKLSWAVGTNYCHIGLVVDKRTKRIIITSTIDNLIKGASGQGVQNMNLMLGYEEDEGLRVINQNI